MSVKVTITVEVGSGPLRSTHIAEAQLAGDNDRFAADQARRGTAMVLAMVLDQMPARQHELPGTGATA